MLQNVRWRVVAALCVAAALAYLQRAFLSVLVGTLQADAELTKEQMGWVLGSFLAAYALGQLPAGALGDRWGARRALPWLCALGSLSVAGMALPVAGAWDAPGLPSPTFAWLASMRFVAGFAQAGLFPCAAVVIAHWLTKQERGRGTGWIASFQQVGAVAATFGTGLLAAHWSWQTICVAYAVPGLLWSAAFWIWFRDRPADHPDVSPGELELLAASRAEAPPASDALPPIDWSVLLRSAPMWCICAQQFFRAIGYIFFGTWFATYLQETRGVDIKTSGMLTSLPLATTFFGGLLSGYISDAILVRTGRRGLARKGVAIFGLLISCVLILAASQVEDALTAVLIISVGSFTAAMGGSAAYAVTIDIAGPRVATVFAIMNMSGNIGAFLFTVAVPYLLKLPGEWNMVLGVFAWVYLLAAVFWMLLRTEGTVFDRTPASRP